MDGIAVRIARALMRASQHTPFRGRGAGFGATADQLDSANPRQRFRQAFAEAERVGDFYAIFPGLDLAGKDVLDFGCGYGGKTVEYARHARFCAGVEPFPAVIRLAAAYARHRRSQAQFRTCSQDRIPYPDNSFDIVVSHDVLEHVDNPQTSLAEIHRVLRPGGKAYIVFPPYDGALSHHLDHVTCLPGMHWLFSAQALAGLAGGQTRRSWDGQRDVLPTLNGLTGRQFKRLISLFAGSAIEPRLIGSNRAGIVAAVRDWLFRPLAKLGLQDRVTGSIAAVLTKAGHASCLSRVPSETKIAA